MNLQDLTSGTINNKPYLNIIANSVKTKTLEADTAIIPEMSTDLINLSNQISVPNAPVGSTSFFSSGSGNLSQTDNLGAVVEYATTDFVGDYLPLDGSSPMQGSITMAGYNLINVQQINGSSTTHLVNDLIVNSGSGVSGNFPSFSSSGKIIQDSGIASTSIASNRVVLDAVSSQVNPIAPAGLRDLWQYNTSGTAPKGSSIIYNPTLNILISSGNAVGLSYSADGGITWANCTLDVASAELLTAGFNSSVMVAVGSGTEAYTSVDGINWTKRAALPSGGESFNIEWFAPASLFVTGCVLAGNRIMTSPDGLVWTTRVAATQALTIKSSSTMLVTVGQASPFSQYSTNATTWTNTPSTVLSSRALAYSAEKREFLMLSMATAEGFRSSDGITWVSVGNIQPVVGVNNALMWLSTFGRWYYTRANADGNYCLWSSTDSSIPFVGTNLDGAINSSLSYSIGYIPVSNRFWIGTNNNPYYVYGTARNDIKALSDNIRVKGGPVVVSKYSTYADVTLNNTTVETNISTTASSIGNLVLQDSQPVGMVIKLIMNLSVTSAAGDTLTIRVKTQAVTVSTFTITVGAGASNSPIFLESLMTVQAATLRYFNKHLIAGVTTATTNTAVYNPAITNTLSVTGQWGAALSTCSMAQMLIDTSFINGA